jgi:hypothetical protein
MAWIKLDRDLSKADDRAKLAEDLAARLSKCFAASAPSSSAAVV